MSTSPRGLLQDAERDTLERLGDDDMASVREAEFQAVALSEHKLRARQAPTMIRGICNNCGDEAPAGWIFCCAECRDDHEHRMSTLQRTVGRV